jgi:hypothetical protein
MASTNHVQHKPCAARNMCSTKHVQHEAAYVRSTEHVWMAMGACVVCVCV